MKFYFVFSPAFLEWPLALSRELKARHPESQVSGIVVGSKRILARVQAATDPVVAPLDHFDPLEREWLATPSPSDRLARHEKRLGAFTLKRILIADRQVGNGFVTGGTVPGSRLISRIASRGDEEHRRYLAGLLDYVFGTLERERPSVVFHYAVADALALALAEACRCLGIPFGTFAPTRVGTRYIVDTSPQMLLEPVRRTFEEGLRQPSTLSRELPAAREYLAEYRKRPARPDYAVDERARFRAQHSLRQIAKRVGALAYGVASASREPLRSSRGRKELAAIRGSVKARWQAGRWGPFEGSEVLDGAPFVYYPLHVNPEASTAVLSPMHTDQSAVIEALAKSLPLGMVLAVKEHVPMLGLRPSGFYERIQRLPGVRLISPFADGFDLIRRGAMTAVITGTAAWEAMLLGRPTLVLGNSPYLAIGQGFTYCPDLSRLPEAIPRALEVPPAEEERLALFLAAVFRESFEFPTRLFWGTVTAETVRSNPSLLREIGDRILALAGDRAGSTGAGTDAVAAG